MLSLKIEFPTKVFLIEFDKLVKYCSASEIKFASVTCMQHGKGMPNDKRLEEIAKLLS